MKASRTLFTARRWSAALLRWASCCAVAVAILMQASQPVRAQSTTTITFWHAMRGDKEKALRDLIADFERANPSIKVVPHYEGSNNKQWGNDYNSLYRGMLESLARQSPPDVAQVYENWTTQLIDYGYVVPVEQYFSSGQAFTQNDLNDIVPVFREANTFGGKVWTLPFNKSIYVLFYNADLLSSQKVAVPTTWDQLRAAAKRLTHPNHSQYGLVVQPNVDSLGHLLYANGGEFISGDRVVFNQAVGASALNYWVDMINSDRSALPTFDPYNGFVEGKGAFYIYSVSTYSSLKRMAHFRVGMAPLPMAAGKKRQVQFAGTNLALFKTTPERQVAAFKFISYMCSAPVSARWALSTGYLPVRRSAQSNPDYQAFLRANPQYQSAALDILKFAKVQPKVSAWESIRGIVDDAFFEAISRRVSSKEALDRAAASANDLLKKILGGTQGM